MVDQKHDTDFVELLKKVIFSLIKGFCKSYIDYYEQNWEVRNEELEVAMALQEEKWYAQDQNTHYAEKRFQELCIARFDLQILINRVKLVLEWLVLKLFFVWS